MVHKHHRSLSPIIVFGKGNYPWRYALAPLRSYISLHIRNRGGAFEKITLNEVFRRTIKTFCHWYPKNSDVFWFTVQRSGFTWLSHLYTIVIAKHFYRKDINLKNLQEYRRLFYESLTGKYHSVIRDRSFDLSLPIPRLIHSHGLYEPWTNNRKLVLQIRNPYDVLISKYYFGKFFEKSDFKSYLKEATPLKMIEFLNSWGRALDRGKFHNYHIIKYEELINKPLETFMRFAEFLGFDDIPTPLVEYSIKVTSIKREREHEMNKKGITDVRYVKMGRSGKINQLDELTADEQAKLLTFIKKNLKYSFGYNIEG